MSTEYTRYFSALTDYNAGTPIDDRDFDGEFDAMVVALNRKVLIKATAPASPIDGQTWINTTLNPPQLEIYDTTKGKWMINYAVPPHYIKGVNLVYVDDASVTANAGEIELQGELLVEVADKTINVDTATWVNGAKGASQWAYIYAYRDSTNSWALAVSDEAPDLSDVSDNTAGILRYQKYGAVYYRYLGAVRLDASVDILKFYERDGWYQWDVQITVLNGGTSTTWANVTCTAAMPATAELAHVAFLSLTASQGQNANWRTDGSAGAGNLLLFAGVASGQRTAAFAIIRTVSQVFEYVWSAGSNSLFAYINGYKDTR